MTLSCQANTAGIRSGRIRYHLQRPSGIGPVSLSGDVACQKGHQFEPSGDLCGDNFWQPFHSSGRRLVLCLTIWGIFFMKHLPSVAVGESLDSVFRRAVWCSVTSRLGPCTIGPSQSVDWARPAGRLGPPPVDWAHLIYFGFAIYLYFLL